MAISASGTKNQFSNQSKHGETSGDMGKSKVKGITLLRKDSLEE